MEQSCDSNFGFALCVGDPTYDLPYAAEEVKYLSRLFQTRPFLGNEARKEVVLQLLGGASIIHIAAHGEPNRGEIMLAPNSSQVQPVPKPESYLLTQRDILNISVQARLVVLCCCHTRQGEITSEGVIGITRAFLAAGARCVLATLWPIDDSATKDFMEKFYCELCQETRVCEALRRTVNLFQKHEIQAYRSSRIWGPFTIYGEDTKFHKNEIKQIREKSCEMFDDFVLL
jgi:CHAT domain-containing protein